MRLGHVYNAKSAFAHVGDDFMKKQPVFDDAEIIGLNNEETGITQGLRRPDVEREPRNRGCRAGSYRDRAD